MTELTSLIMNYSLVYGCFPGTGVKADTKMCKDICEALLKGLGADMYSEFPHFMESIKGDDVNFEINSSTTLQPLRLYYSRNVVEELQGYVFVFTHLEGLGDWEGTES